MRAAVLAVLLMSLPAAAAPDAPVLCLTRPELNIIDSKLAEQHASVARLAAENAELRKQTKAIAAEKQSTLPVVIAVLVGAAAGAGATLWAVSR